MKEIRRGEYTLGDMDQRGNQFFEIASKRICFSRPELSAVAGYELLILNIEKKGIWGRAYLSDKVGEGLIGLNLKELVDPEEANFVIREKIVAILAHETRHLFQPRRNRQTEFLYKIALKFSSRGYLITLSALALTTIILRILFFVGKGPGDQIWFHVFLEKASIPLAIVLMLLALFILVNPFERDARAFAKKAFENEDWFKVVSVENLAP